MGGSQPSIFDKVFFWQGQGSFKMYFLFPETGGFIYAHAEGTWTLNTNFHLRSILFFKVTVLILIVWH